jgi:hypothetical protein
MTDEQTIATITRILIKARLAAADPDWTARAIITSLRGTGWRPTQAEAAPDWQRRDVTPAPPTADYLAARRICVWQRTTPTGWALRLIHPACPHHGGHPHWKAPP